MLTRKQHELLMFIHERIKETGVSPSFDEMKEALDLASKSGIHRLIMALEDQGCCALTAIGSTVLASARERQPGVILRDLERLPHRIAVGRAMARGARGT